MDAEELETEVSDQQHGKGANAGKTVSDVLMRDEPKKEEVTNENDDPTVEDDDDRMPIVPLTGEDTENIVENSYIVPKPDHSHTESELLVGSLLTQEQEARKGEDDTGTASMSEGGKDTHDKEQCSSAEITILVQNFPLRDDSADYLDRAKDVRIIKVDGGFDTISSGDEEGKQAVAMTCEELDLPSENIRKHTLEALMMADEKNELCEILRGSNRPPKERESPSDEQFDRRFREDHVVLRFLVRNCTTLWELPLAE